MSMHRLAPSDPMKPVTVHSHGLQSPSEVEQCSVVPETTRRTRTEPPLVASVLVGLWMVVDAWLIYGAAQHVIWALT